jgi:hypothetical protein
MSVLNSAFSAALKTWLFLMRQDSKLLRLNLRRLCRSNRHSRNSVVAPGGPVVSLTTHGERVRTVYLTIESIGLGALLPSRMILWLQDEEIYRHRPESLRRLESRGLEVCLTESYGPHSKYFPYLMSTDTFHDPLATADDDMVYSSWWLAGLARAHNQDPRLVNCYRAHSMQLANGVIKPYLNWEICKTTEPSARCFATGASGCIYPVGFLGRLKRAGPGFLELCPKADDVWLHVNALRAGFKVRQIHNRPLNFPMIPGTQKNSLFQVNWTVCGGNNEQIRNTYTADDLKFLMSCTESAEQPVMQCAP